MIAAASECTFLAASRNLKAECYFHFGRTFPIITAKCRVATAVFTLQSNIRKESRINQVISTSKLRGKKEKFN